MATNSASVADFPNLRAVFNCYYDTAWKDFAKGNYENAEEMAARLLKEPRLSEFHQTGMHLILSMSPHDYVEHGKEAVRLS